MANFEEINKFVDEQLAKNLYTPGFPNLIKEGGEYSIRGIPSALRSFDIFAIAHWLRGVGKELFGGINFKDGFATAATSTLQSKGIQFVASQFLLASLNPNDPEVGGGFPAGNTVYNPLSPIISALPFTRPSRFTAVTLGPVFDNVYDPTASRIDKYTTATKAFAETRAFEPEEILRRKIPSALPDLFSHKEHTGFEFIKKAVSLDRKIQPKDTPEIVDARFWEYGYEHLDKPPSINTEAVVYVDETPDKNGIPDDENYMPFMFQDLRDNPENFLYFRAFIKPDSLKETFTPEWTQTRYYGRTEYIPIYMGTIRNIELAFDVVAWQPADLNVIYRKLHKLQSMVYPLYDAKGFLQAGPIIRMRVGDLISGKRKRGLSGYLTSLDFAYDNVWNIEAGEKVPRHIIVTLAFTALHEGNPGIYPFKNVTLGEKDKETVVSEITDSDRVKFGVRSLKEKSENVYEVSEQAVRGTDLIKDFSWKYKIESNEQAKNTGEG